MATTDERQRRRKTFDFGFNPTTTFEGAVRDASRHAGGGARGAGAGVREVLRQGVGVPTEAILNSAADSFRTVVTPTASFTAGLLTGAPATVPAPNGGVAVPNVPTLRTVTPQQERGPDFSGFPTLSTVVAPQQGAQAPSLVRSPSRGQPAPAVPARSQAAAPAFDINNVPQGGGFISFDEPLSADRLARLPPDLRTQAQTGEIRVTPERARELAGRGTVVPAGAITQLGSDGRGGIGGLPQRTPNVQDVQGAVPSGLPDAPRRSTLVSDRSQDFDALLNNLVEQATRRPDSFGALFRRRGVLDALSNVAGVAQSAGTNTAQDIANVRNAVEQRLSAELTDRSQEADRGVRTRGQDLVFEEGLLRNAVAARNAELQADTTRDVSTSRDEVLREGQIASSADVAARIAARERELANFPALQIQANPRDRLVTEILGANNVEDREALLDLFVRIYGNTDPLTAQLLQLQQGR